MGETAPDPVVRTAGPRRGRRRRWGLAAGVGLVALIAFVVVWRLVGGGDLQRLAGAADATIAAGTARVAVVGTVEGVPLVGPFTLTVAEGEVDLAGQRARLLRQVPGVSSVPLLDRLLPEPVEILHDRGASYLRLPIGAERAWVRLGEPEDLTEHPDLVGPGLANPAAALGLLRALEGLPRVDGPDVVRGQASTRFRVTVDLERAANVLSGRARDVALGLRRIRGRNDLSLDVWLDDADRVTRLRYRVEPELGGARISLTTDLELFDFGIPVAIRAPAADALVSLPTGRVRDLDPLRWLRGLLGG